MHASRRAVVGIVVTAVGCYYLWAVRAAGHRFDWGRDLGGYYDYLGRAFAKGQLHLPIEPSRELLALPNPWDPAVPDEYKMHDMALFNGRYYLYHGAGPAVILFAPWRLLTRHDLPENFALFLLCFGGFLFSCGALLRLLALADVKPGPGLLAAMLLALGICQSVPYLLSRVWVYEIAIGGGYFCISGALFFLVRGIESHSSYWLAASGLMFGLAIACRPHLGLAAAAALAGLAILRKRELIVFAAALTLAGAMVALYNYARFGDPFEFGIRYLLSGVNQNRIKPAAAHILPGLYFFLFCAPDFSPVFPWVRIVFRYPFNSPEYSFPPGFVIEPMVGALYLAPFVLAAFFVPSAERRTRILIWTLVASSAAVLLFLATTGWSTQRYAVDFLPTAVLAVVASFAIRISRSTGPRRMVLQAALTALIAYSAVANLALGLSGPYNEMLKNRPASYLRIARWFSPAAQFRPMMNPELDVTFNVDVKAQPEGFREPLITMGHQLYRHFIYMEHGPGVLRIVSRSDTGAMVHEMKASNEPLKFQATFSRNSGNLTTSVNGQQVLAHHIGNLFTAPAQVTEGENRIDPSVTARRFTGTIRDVRKSVRAD
jgi:hypothetical protein